MNTNTQSKYQEAYDLVAGVPAGQVYGQVIWRETYPHLEDVEFVLESFNWNGRPRVLARGDLGEIAEELAKGWSDDWLNHFENGGYSDSTIGEWLSHYDANLRVIKPRRKKQ
jgi:hypothetical protein